MFGLAAKHDSGSVKNWGINFPKCLTAWEVLGGPVIGFRFKAWTETGSYMSIIVGDRCRPRYFGARKLSLRLGEEREV